MGYTHYYKIESKLTTEESLGVVNIVLGIFSKTDVPIQFEYDSKLPPRVNAKVIHFNGVGGDGHETFHLDLCLPGVLDFCKTNQKPYDTVVVAVLAGVKDVLGSKFSWESDGVGDDLKAGLDLLAATYCEEQVSG